MKIAKALIQNTETWHLWRGKGLGASDAPTIMGVSPWSTAFELWLEKTGQTKRRDPNPFAAAAMLRGVLMEPEARAWYEAQTGLTMETISAEHEQYPYIRASLDGYNAEQNIGIEIKCPGKASHAKTLKSREVPDNYMPQIQQQLLVTGASRIDFVSYSGSIKIESIIIPVYPDPEYQKVLLKKLIDFWLCVQGMTPPELDKRDLPRILSQLTEDLKTVSNTAKALTALAQTMNKGSK